MFEFALSVKALGRELERWTTDAMRPLGVTGPQADAISVIGRAGPLSLKELGDVLIAEAGHPSRLVDRLVEAGLVERITDGDDRRRVQLTLTKEGRRLAKRIDATRHEMYELGRALVGKRDLAAAQSVLRDLLRHSAYGPVLERRARLEAGR